MIPPVETVFVGGEFYIIANGKTYALGPAPKPSLLTEVIEWLGVAVFVLGTIAGYATILWSIYRWAHGEGPLWG